MCILEFYPELCDIGASLFLPGLNMEEWGVKAGQLGAGHGYSGVYFMSDYWCVCSVLIPTSCRARDRSRTRKLWSVGWCQVLQKKTEKEESVLKWGSEKLLPYHVECLGSIPQHCQSKFIQRKEGVPLAVLNGKQSRLGKCRVSLFFGLGDCRCDWRYVCHVTGVFESSFMVSRWYLGNQGFLLRFLVLLIKKKSELKQKLEDNFIRV